jgi:Glutaminase
MPPPVTLQRAQQLYDLVNAKVCCPASAPAPCIPFLYPDDGCWGRAHEMCRLMIADGAQPQKVWIYGNLTVQTANNPGCHVNWGWHVAPTLEVTVGGTDTYVIDPSLFPGPVTKATWKSVQGDPSATLVDTDASVFHRSVSGIEIFDPTYTQTQSVLTTYRNALKVRSASPSGPPPYFNCMTLPAGVQWFGSVAPNSSHRWFTWGWPVTWNVIWTIMPVTICPGAPQLTWTVEVERSNATQCTYWITVTNLTGDPVKFEGRYNIL